MVKKIFLLTAILLSSINAAQAATMKIAAISAVLAGNAASLAWIGSRYTSQEEITLENLANYLEQEKMPPEIHEYLEEITKPIIPSGKKVIFSYYNPALIHKAASAITCRVPGRNFIAFPAGHSKSSIWRTDPQEGDPIDAVRIEMGPCFTYTLTHELKHIIEDDTLQRTEYRQNVRLGALGLSVLSLASSIQNLRKPLSTRMTLLVLAISPFYYISTKLNEYYKIRQQEMTAEKFAMKYATDEKLKEMHNDLKHIELSTNKHIYTSKLKRLYKGDINWDDFYVAITHPTRKDTYDMVTTEMKKRNIKPIDSNNS